MPKANVRSDKYFWLDPSKIKRAQKALGAKTETETITRALDLVISAAARQRALTRANIKFRKSSQNS
jgi:hypothetical protein